MAKERYLRMQHDCFDALAVIPLTDSERRVMMVVIRYTVGFRRYDADLSNKFIASFLGNITEQHAGRCINHLCKRGFIKILSKGIGTHPRRIRFCYAEFRGTFRDIQRNIWIHLEEHSDTFRGTSECSKEIKEEIKNKEKKKKKHSQSEFKTFFLSDLDEPPEIVEDDPEANLTEEEWIAIHGQDDWEDDENDL